MKAYKIVGSILATAGSLTFNPITPERISNVRVSYAVYLIGQLKYELCFCLILGLFLILPANLWKRHLLGIKGWFFGLSEKLGLERIFFIVTFTSIISIPMIIFFPSLISEVKNIVKARVYFYQELLPVAFRSELLKKAIVLEKAGKLARAEAIYRKIIDYYPNDAYIIGRWERLQGRIAYSNNIFERALKLERSDRRMSRQSFGIIMESLLINPGNEDIKRAVDARIEKLRQGEDSIGEFWRGCKEGREEIIVKGLADWGWFLFEEQILPRYFSGSFRSANEKGSAKNM